MATDTHELSRAGSVMLAQCPACASHAVTRESGGASHGPMDACERCGRRFAAKPGSKTVHQHVAAMNAAPTAMLSRFAKSLGGNVR
jgi:ribosomal protein L37AE/L43A